MRNKLSLRNFAILVALVAVTLVIGLYGTTNRSKTNGGNGTIALEPPFFISVAEAASTGATAFPADKAGISAYVKLPTTIDLDKVRTIFTKVEDIGDNYIIGIVPIANLGEDTDVHLYADTDGWLVAYLTLGEPAAKIMKWRAQAEPVAKRRESLRRGASQSASDTVSPITKITTTTLREALNSAGRAVAVRIPPEIKYYDFKFPDANAMTLFVKVTSSQTEIIQVKFPTDWTLNESSYYHYGYDRGRSTGRRPRPGGTRRGGTRRGPRGSRTSGPTVIGDLKVDGALISQMILDNAQFDSYQGAIIPGVLHTIEINTTESYNAAVATVLIYRTD